jgi:putative oxidoreductase
METDPGTPNRALAIALTVVLWVATLLSGVGIGVVGLAKFGNAHQWERFFVGWGYPAWMSFVVGVAEVAGAVALFIPRIALAGVLILGAVMIGALVTLLLHRGGPMGWGATPAIHLVLLSAVGAIRWSRR